MGFVIDGIPKWSELDSELGYVLKIINTHSSAMYLSDKIYQLFFVNKDKISRRQSSCPHIKYFKPEAQTTRYD